MRVLKYVVKGDPRTKKNHQQIAGAGRRCPRCGKFEKIWIRQGTAHDDFAELAKWQLKPRPETPISTTVNIKYLFFMKTRRKVDGLNLCAAMDDILVSCGIIEDDNSRIVIGHDGTRVLYDPENPRTEISIFQIEQENEQISFC